MHGADVNCRRGALPRDWSDEALAQSRRTLDRMYAVLRDVKHRLGALPAATEPGEAAEKVRVALAAEAEEVFVTSIENAGERG